MGKLAARGKDVLFLPQNLDIWGQKSIFCLMIAIFVDGTNDHYTRGSNFPIGTTPKKFSVSELGVILWGSPLFLAIFGHSHVRRATDPVRAGITEKRAFLRSAEKWFLA